MREGSSFSFEPAAYDIQDQNSDAVMTSIHTTGRQVTLLNAYIATVKTSAEDTRRDEFQPTNLPRGRSVIIAADVNAHHELWDDNRARDARGTKIAEWMDQHDMCVLNTGEPTRHDSSGRGTAPDVTICHTALAVNAEWSVGEDLASDHRPLHIKVEVDKKPRPTRRRARPCLRKADWSKYRTITDTKFKTKLRHLISSETATKRLTRIMVQAAEEAIPRSPPRRNAKAWWCEEAEVAVKQRREARESLKRDPGNEELMTLCSEKTVQAKQIVKQAKLTAWSRECEKMEAATDSSRLYATIKAMDGRGKKHESAAVLKSHTKTAKTDKEKANILARHYAKVSQAQFSTASQAQKRHWKARRMAVNRTIAESCAQHPSCRGESMSPIQYD